MPALSGTRNLKRFYKQTFIRKEGTSVRYRHTLLVNPDDMSVNEPAKTNVQQTLGGAYVTKFGAGLHTVTISGTTGYRARYNADGEIKDGYTEMKTLRRELYRAYVESTSDETMMFWYNWEDEEYYRIEPTNFRIMRNKSEPLLYRYEFQFTCLYRLDNVRMKPGVQMDINNIIDIINLVKLKSSAGNALSSLGEARSRF